jgi:hypothetical protein
MHIGRLATFLPCLAPATSAATPPAKNAFGAEHREARELGPKVIDHCRACMAGQDCSCGGAFDDTHRELEP